MLPKVFMLKKLTLTELPSGECTKKVAVISRVNSTDSKKKSCFSGNIYLRL